MLFVNPISGSELPVKTISLSYDDGPGPGTLEVADYLRSQRIPATFFVMGSRVIDHEDVLSRVCKMGHLLGNHTFNHADLVELSGTTKSAVEREVLDTHEAIKTFTRSIFLFRPPYGSWNRNVARVLNHNPDTRLQVGPIFWDVDGSDWECWRNGIDPQACADRYFDLIEEAGRGIVLLHDGSPKQDLIQRNRALELTKILVKKLQASNYEFVRIDEIPQVNSACQKLYGLVDLCFSPTAPAVEMTTRKIQCILGNRFGKASLIARIGDSRVGSLAMAALLRIYFVVPERIRRSVLKMCLHVIG